jgi:hypothetical protein
MKRLFRFILVSLVVCISPLLALSQGIQQTPYSAADQVRRGAPAITSDLTPSNPLGLPGSSLRGQRGSDNVSISSGMFHGLMPQIPNLQLGYNYTFGPQLRAATASVDYLLPFKIGSDTTVYGEAHGEFQTLSIAQPGSPNNSTELCFGGGYRRMLGKRTMVGVNSFLDTTKLSGTWYSSATAGLEMAAMISGHDAIDLIFNWYGKALDASIFSGTPAYAATAANASFGNSNFDFQVGYSHELYNGGPDFRVSATGYKLECGSNVYGYYAGAELKSRDGMFVAKYDVGYDNANQIYQSVAAFMNMGLQLENLLDGKSPFVKPKPVFQSPRNMSTLTQAKPNRNWRHTTQAATSAVLSAKTSQCLGSQTITIYNMTQNTITLYMVFQAGSGGYTLPDSFPGWTLTSNPLMITTSMAPSSPTQNPPPKPIPLVVNFPCTTQYMPINISADGLPQTGCSITQFEINMCAGGGPVYQDTYDISLVNGFNYPGEIKPDSGTAIMVCCGTPNKTNPGVYPWGCDICTAQSPNGGSPCPTSNPDCKSGTQYDPTVPCGYTVNSTNYTLYIGSTPDVPSPAPAWCPGECPTSTSTCTSGTCSTQ